MLRLALFVGLGAQLTACASSHHGVELIKANETPQVVLAGSPRLPKGDISYRVSPLDTLQIEVFPVLGQANSIDYGSQVRVDLMFVGGSYVVAPGDVLSIEVNIADSTTTQVSVRPDGRITLPRLSQEIQAAGLTPRALSAAVTRAYSAILRAPTATVSVARSETDYQSQISGNYQVGPGGNIGLPVLGSFPAVRLTTGQLAAEITRVASERFRNPIRATVVLTQLSGRDVDQRLDPVGRFFFSGPVTVSPDGDIHVRPGNLVNIAKLTLSDARQAVVSALQPFYANPIDARISLVGSSSLSVFVGGEVRNPGRYSYTGPTTLLQLVAQSGWTTQHGSLKNVLLLHPTERGKYDVFRANLQEVIQAGKVDQDLAVGPQDIVLVPMTGVGKVDKFIDQYIRQVLPFTASASFTYVTPSGAVNPNVAGTTP